MSILRDMGYPNESAMDTLRSFQRMSNQTVFRAEMRAGMALSRRNAHFPILGITDGLGRDGKRKRMLPPEGEGFLPWLRQQHLYGLTVIRSRAIPRGKAFLIDGKLAIHPFDWQRIQKPPLWSRHMLGVREAERHRRQRRTK